MKLEGAKKAEEDYLAAMERMLDLFDDIERDGRIHFRVYAMIDDEQDEEVEIVRTRGFDSHDLRGEPDQ